MKNLKDIIFEKLIINKNTKINENYVDLDLPSKNLWCKYNFGCKKETDYGEYLTGKQAFTKNYILNVYQKRKILKSYMIIVIINGLIIMV